MRVGAVRIGEEEFYPFFHEIIAVEPVSDRTRQPIWSRGRGRDTWPAACCWPAPE